MPIIAKLYNRSCMEDHSTLTSPSDSSPGLQANGDKVKRLRFGLGEENTSTGGLIPASSGWRPRPQGYQLTGSNTPTHHRGKEQRIWVCGEKTSGQKQWAEEPSCREKGTCKGSTAGTAQVCHGPSEGSPDPAPEHCT